MYELPWKNEIEFYELHSKDIFSNFPFYHVSMIGNSKREFLRHIVTKSRISRQAKVVDLGCGSGYLTDSLNKSCQCVGISTSSECIKQAKSNFPDTTFELANMETYISKNATHFLALESLGYTNIKKTFKNIFNNLDENGIFYLKDLFLKFKENDMERENREDWGFYWNYHPLTIPETINVAYKTGFKLLEFNDLSGKTNNQMFLESLKFNKVEYKMPHPKVDFLIPGEFVFIKLNDTK